MNSGIFSTNTRTYGDKVSHKGYLSVACEVLMCGATYSNVRVVELSIDKVNDLDVLLREKRDVWFVGKCQHNGRYLYLASRFL